MPTLYHNPARWDGNIVTRVASLLTLNEHRALVNNSYFASIVWC